MSPAAEHNLSTSVEAWWDADFPLCTPHMQSHAEPTSAPILRIAEVEITAETETEIMTEFRLNHYSVDH